MKCIYPNGIELTEEQSMGLNEIIGSVEQFMKGLVKLAVDVLDHVKKILATIYIKRKQNYNLKNEITMKSQVMDRRPMMHVIRNSC